MNNRLKTILTIIYPLIVFRPDLGRPYSGDWLWNQVNNHNGRLSKGLIVIENEKWETVERYVEFIFKVTIDTRVLYLSFYYEYKFPFDPNNDYVVTLLDYYK